MHNESIERVETLQRRVCIMLEKCGNRYYLCDILNTKTPQAASCWKHEVEVEKKKSCKTASATVAVKKKTS